MAIRNVELERMLKPMRWLESDVAFQIEYFAIFVSKGLTIFGSCIKLIENEVTICVILCAVLLAIFAFGALVDSSQSRDVRAGADLPIFYL